MRVLWLMLLLAGSAVAEDWHCRNPALEVRCAEGACSASSEGFTPLAVSFDARGRVEVCAYSGCWQGSGRVWRDGAHWLLSARGLAWLADARQTADFMLTFDARERLATLQGAGFALPLVCEAAAQAAS